MKIKMNGGVERVLEPWEFSIEVDGKTHATRPMTLADVAVIESMQGKPVDPMQLADVAASLFAEDQRPQLGGWPLERLRFLVEHYMAFAQARTKKNSTAARELAAGAATPAGAASAS